MSYPPDVFFPPDLPFSPFRCSGIICSAQLLYTILPYILGEDSNVAKLEVEKSLRYERDDQFLSGFEPVICPGRSFSMSVLRTLASIRLQ